MRSTSLAFASTHPPAVRERPSRKSVWVSEDGRFRIDRELVETGGNKQGMIYHVTDLMQTEQEACLDSRPRMFSTFRRAYEVASLWAKEADRNILDCFG